MSRRLFSSLILLCLLTFAVSAKSQRVITRIVSIEINRKEVKKPYRVILSAGGRELQATRTPDGFVLPDNFRQERTITAHIIFGKYDLALYDIPISRFSDEWRIGVNKKPFEEQFLVTPEERRNLLFIYYVDFDQTQLFFKVYKRNSKTKSGVSRQNHRPQQRSGRASSHSAYVHGQSSDARFKHHQSSSHYRVAQRDQ